MRGGTLGRGSCPSRIWSQEKTKMANLPFKVAMLAK